MKKHYQFTVEGSSADENTWLTSGDFTCELHETFDRAMGETFTQLTKGKAIYGKPGVGCNGPYDIHRLVIEQVKQ